MGPVGGGMLGAIAHERFNSPQPRGLIRGHAVVFARRRHNLPDHPREEYRSKWPKSPCKM